MNGAHSPPGFNPGSTNPLADANNRFLASPFMAAINRASPQFGQAFTNTLHNLPTIDTSQPIIPQIRAALPAQASPQASSVMANAPALNPSQPMQQSPVNQRIIQALRPFGGWGRFNGS